MYVIKCRIQTKEQVHREMAAGQGCKVIRYPVRPNDEPCGAPADTKGAFAEDSFGSPLPLLHHIWLKRPYSTDLLIEPQSSVIDLVKSLSEVH